MNTSEDRLNEKLQNISNRLVELTKENNQLTSNIINLAEKRNTMTEERTQRTRDQSELNHHNTDLAEERTSLSEKRTVLAQERTELAESRTDFSIYRSILAKGRTELAFIRTGFSFIALGIGLMRYFGFGPWTTLDAGIVVIGAVSGLYGSTRFITTMKFQRIYDRKMKAFLASELEGVDKK
ncbi:DUF202 domain-containing protein [Desulforhopalus vacuolatus]|uniref:DUF202 domain-containing protein n=1 Tax=Desulforhopalus vacuolatus TaxID=40414 RepID=UPI001962476E|nr:DUF202 domain-containing protein [Desulforhopalus vacuolatus]MBM9519653.1 DUF202 domain-containing protein [Desulforhopalus vacuolatus]